MKIDEAISLIKNTAFLGYNGDDDKMSDAIQTIEQLVGKAEQLEEAVGRMAIELAAVKKERDAALKDLKCSASCDVCKNIGEKCRDYWEIGEMGLNGLCQGENWEWRGIDERTD